MKPCPKCFNPSNPPDATQCTDCGNPLDRTAELFHRTCPRGKHQMDPSWDVCAFCKAEGIVEPVGPAPAWAKTLDQNDQEFKSGHTKTQFDPNVQPTGMSGDRQGWPREAKGVTTMDPKLPNLYEQNRGSSAAGRFDSGLKKLGVQKTVFGAPVAGLAPAAGDCRRVVAVLVTYTWKPEGEVYLIREGRNKIGRDPKQCDIVISQDDSMSAENTSITFRSKFVVTDKDSMCGTYVNGVAIEEPSYPLPNYSTVRAGSTTFSFVTIEPSQTAE